MNEEIDIKLFLATLKQHVENHAEIIEIMEHISKRLVTNTTQIERNRNKLIELILWTEKNGQKS